jgi:hypothetical protein
MSAFPEGGHSVVTQHCSLRANSGFMHRSKKMRSICQRERAVNPDIVPEYLRDPEPVT